MAVTFKQKADRQQRKCRAARGDQVADVQIEIILHRIPQCLPSVGVCQPKIPWHKLVDLAFHLEQNVQNRNNRHKRTEIQYGGEEMKHNVPR